MLCQFLSSGNSTSSCNSLNTGQVCNKRHHTLLHFEITPFYSTTKQPQSWPGLYQISQHITDSRNLWKNLISMYKPAIIDLSSPSSLLIIILLWFLMNHWIQLNIIIHICLDSSPQDDKVTMLSTDHVQVIHTYVSSK